MSNLTMRELKVPALLVALSVVPLAGGVLRFMNMTPAAAASPEHARFAQAPAPIALHIASAALFCVLGAFQFSPGVRARWPRFHRRAGKVLVLCGLAAGASGVWMTAFYAIPPSMQGALLYGARLTVGLAMIAALLLAWASILRRDVARHEAFMIRGYALGQGAGTQVLVLGPWMAIAGDAVGFTRDVLMTLAWLINVAVAERIIRARASAAKARP